MNAWIIEIVNERTKNIDDNIVDEYSKDDHVIIANAPLLIFNILFLPIFIIVYLVLRERACTHEYSVATSYC